MEMYFFSIEQHHRCQSMNRLFFVYAKMNELMSNINRMILLDTAYGYSNSSLSHSDRYQFLFQIAEIIGGYLAGSLAIITDAAHLLSDCISFIVAIIAIYLSKKRPDNRMSFGYKRAGTYRRHNIHTRSTMCISNRYTFVSLNLFYTFFCCRGSGCYSLDFRYLDIDAGSAVSGHQSIARHELRNRCKCNDDRFGIGCLHQHHASATH